jgi:hypothetical protein
VELRMPGVVAYGARDRRESKFRRRRQSRG